MVEIALQARLDAAAAKRAEPYLALEYTPENEDLLAEATSEPVTITVRCSSGDEAEAETPEAALLAARTLMGDAWDARPNQGHNPTAAFIVAGEVVRTVTAKEIGLVRV